METEDHDGVSFMIISVKWCDRGGKAGVDGLKGRERRERVRRGMEGGRGREEMGEGEGQGEGYVVMRGMSEAEESFERVGNEGLGDKGLIGKGGVIRGVGRNWWGRSKKDRVAPEEGAEGVMNGTVVGKRSKVKKEKDGDESVTAT